MPASTALKERHSRDSAQDPTPQSHSDGDREFDYDSDDSDDALEKSKTEQELERLVFGDTAGFRANLRDFSLQEHEDAEEALATGLEGLDDADLFFTDLAPSDVAIQPPAKKSNEHDDGAFRSRLPPAWEDSDDERMMVSLATAPRLRKLRRTEAEDVISGKEYSKRLRRQFELLNPVPGWAQEAIEQPAAKKRRLSQDGGDGVNSDVSDEGAESDTDNPSVAPLSKLLQGADSLARSASRGAGKKRKLRPEVLDIERQKDIELIQPSAITSLSFHPSLPLLLSSGPSSTLYLHHLAPSPPAPAPNPLLTSLHILKSHLTTTAFHPTDSRIFLSSRKPYFHIWNLDTGRVEKILRIAGQRSEQRTMEVFKLSPDGKYIALLGTAKKTNSGTVNILDATTLQWAMTARIDSRGGVADFAWWRSGRGLCIASRSGEVTEWDVEQQRAVARWQDEGAVGTSVLALGGVHEHRKSPIGTDRWIAIGSSSGIVNLYDRREWLAAASKAVPATGDAASTPVPAFPKPTRMLDHLTTPITNLVFSPDGQVLAMASRLARDAMRLVHLPTCTVFRNWPTSSTPLGRVSGVAFAGGEVVEGDDVHSVLAVANEQGKIRLWQIR